MIAVGESGDTIVLVFDTAKAKQCLTDEEGAALHAQLGLMLVTRAKRKGAPSPLQTQPASPQAFAAMAAFGPEPLPAQRPPTRATKRRPMVDAAPAEDTPIDVASLIDEAGDNSFDAMNEAIRRDEEQVARNAEESQRKRRAKARAAAGLPPEDEEVVT